MTLIRRAAVAISARVVRWSAPGCREWAEGLENEVEFIDSDWRALAWSLGSVRVLLDRRATAGTGSGVAVRGPSRLDVLIWLLYLSVGLNFCVFMLTSTGLRQRVGWGLALLACGYWATCSVFNRLRDRRQPSTSDIVAYRLFLREGLALKLARYRTVRRWFPALASLAGWVGYLLIAGGQNLFGGFFVAMVWMGGHPLDTPAKIQGRIERMDALIAQAQQAGLKLKRVHSDHWGRPSPDTRIESMDALIAKGSEGAAR
jgi:hypothetical protein